MNNPIISIIVAMDEKRGIGKENKLMWRLPNELSRFKKITMGHPIIMGRITHESIGRVLPGRLNIVISRKSEHNLSDENTQNTNCIFVNSLGTALELAKQNDQHEIFIIGGAELYRESLGRANRLYLTRVCASVEGDTSLPDIEWNNWQLVESEDHDANEKNEHAYRFETYDRS